MPHGRIFNLFRRFRAGDPTAAVANIRDLDLLKNFVEGLHGVGCRVWKDTEGSLRNCRIIVDGSSDIAADETEEMAQYRRQAAGGFPFGSRWSWGLALAGAVASVYNGRMERYPSRYDATNPTEITFTDAGYFWIGYLFETQTNTLTITGPLDDEPYTGDVGHEDDVEEGRYRGPLYKIVATDDGGDPAAVVALLMTRDYIHGMKHPQVYG